MILKLLAVLTFAAPLPALLGGVIRVATGFTVPWAVQLTGVALFGALVLFWVIYGLVQP